jgi:dipeptidyl aminopeptidase/acylaminoacyl peptidase
MKAASALRMVEEGEFERLPPVWIAHAERDENVTLEMTERFVDAYRTAGGQIEMALFPAVGHGFANMGGDDADRGIEQMVGFIGTRLATRPAVSPGD